MIIRILLFFCLFPGKKEGERKRNEYLIMSAFGFCIYLVYFILLLSVLTVKLFVKKKKKSQVIFVCGEINNISYFTGPRGSSAFSVSFILFCFVLFL